jgi:hypothetical protein
MQPQRRGPPCSDAPERLRLGFRGLPSLKLLHTVLNEAPNEDGRVFIFWQADDNAVFAALGGWR